MNPIARLATCVTAEHAPAALGLAVALCLAAFLVDHGLGQLLHTVPHRERPWRWARAAVLGLGVWATHFVSMIGYTVASDASHAVLHTMASLVLIIAALGWIKGWQKRANAGGIIHGSHRALQGVTAGAAVVVMHYVGMAGWQLPGRVTWELPGVALSLLGGLGLFAAAEHISAAGKARHAAPVLAAVGVAVIHYFSMSALVVLPAAPITDPPLAFTAETLAIPIVLAVAAVLAATVFACWLLLARHRQRMAERQRLLTFANLALEGLLICHEGTILNANGSVANLAAEPEAVLRGRAVGTLFDPPAAVAAALEGEVDANLVRADQARIPVRLLAKHLSMGGRNHLLLAVRDQRERLRAEAELRAMAETDPLTGLDNRRAFTVRLGEALDHDGPAALLIIDLDGFKTVNDTLGHGAGDVLLTRAADRIAAVIGDEGRLARLGGDEFAVLLPGKDVLAAEALAASIVERLSYPFLVNAQVCDIGASVGIAMAHENGAKPSTLVRNADLAMYAAKDSGRSCWMRFDEHMHGRVQERHSLELDLRRAVARREFEVHFQPLHLASDGSWSGAEALVRWPHAVRGLVSPALFVPLAEEIGLIGEIGQWVLAQAASEARAWPEQTHVAVNISPRQLADPGLVDRVATVLADTRLPPSRLELEVTESALLADEEHTRIVLTQLRNLGVGLALDDFGTGFSSLSALHRYPFTRLKIDRSFIAGCTENDSRAGVVRTIAVLAQTLGMAVTAEGIETGEQREFVTALGCQTLQGYLFGRPMPAADIRRLARGQRRHLQLAEGAA